MITPINTLPTPPSRQRPATFSDEADAFLGALPDFGDEANILAGQVNILASQTSERAGEAVTARNETLTYRDEARTSATTATQKAGEAANAAAASEQSAIGASKLNLGAKSSPPTLDNQGLPILAGATYYDTTLGKWRVWTGTAWGDGISSIAGVSSWGGLTGNINPLPMLHANALSF